MVKGYSSQHDECGVSDEYMAKLADHIEAYLNMREDTMIIPKHLLPAKSTIKQAFVEARIAVTKLRKGKRSVFKDVDDWNSV